MNIIKTIRGFAFACLAVLVVFSCTEDQIDTYSGEADAFFSLKRWASSQTSSTANSTTYRVTDFPVDGTLYSDTFFVQTTAWDSLEVSLAMDGTEVGYHVTLIPVSLSGNLVDYDRPLAYSLGKNSTAVEDTHFKVKAMIPANNRTGALAVSINRETVKDTVLFVDFHLLPNEHFRTNFAPIARSTTDTTKVDLYQFRLRMSSFIEKPKFWDSNMRVYFGVYSQKKMFLILELTGGDIQKLYGDKAPDLGLMIAWGKILKVHLVDQKAKGNPVLEEDGSEMAYGTAV